MQDNFPFLHYNKTWNMRSYVQVHCQTTNLATGVCVNTPEGGHFRSATSNVEMAVIYPGAMIFYTTDGSTPTGASTRYTAPINVAGLGSDTVTLKAAAFRNTTDTDPLGVVTTSVYTKW